MKLLNVQLGFFMGPPSVDEMLKYDLWEMHEAIFMLTCWPENVGTCSCKETMRGKNIGRQHFYQPCPPPEDRNPSEWRFNPKKMGRDYQKIYSEVKKAIKTAALPAMGEPLYIGDVYGEGISYLISPTDLIRWALLIANKQKGFQLPDNLQIAFGVHQMRGRPQKAPESYLKNQIAAQFAKIDDPGFNANQLCEHPLMRIFGIGSVSSKRRAINKVLAKGKRGRLSSNDVNKDIRPFLNRPVSEVVQKGSDGIVRYHLPSLSLSMKTAARILILKIGEPSLSKMTMAQFLKKFIKHKVVSLHLEGASETVLELVRSFAVQVLTDHLHIQAMLQFGSKIRCESENAKLYLDV
ncbi:MAG: hypothetical protein LLG04_08975 [Parachlamydia sp.]|nr:hypothetical protein [Parachlamydia sp.]